MEDNELRTLLREWSRVPEPLPGGAAALETRLRAKPAPAGGWSVGAQGLRAALTCALVGAVVGAAVAEWYTLRHESLVNSRMSVAYLRSIDPELEGHGR
jgi:hypothetical protein